MGKLPDRTLAQPVAARQDGQHGLEPGAERPAGTPSGEAQVRVPHCVQVRRCSRYSVTSGWKGGISAT